ncbi:C4-type zinc ribbon domain-containing protein [uncultured Microscilla sp.]|uniref:zinc ribbon domain-containing protein n=1 Tax=uncultured Microscilla sp. TaxID=432653 RepID=UPI0026282620|nr:C4-type zinc ribbon domain-containing protein [uncultured Microscilla sp.]
MERTVSQKLTALLKMQSIDSKMDELKKMRGDLPEEVQDLEDEIAGYETRIDKFNRETKGWEDEISAKKQRKKDADKLILKYKDQQMNVRNNREYDALSKEVESEELEIQLADKKIKEAKAKIESKKGEIDKTKQILDERQKDLAGKKEELDSLLNESQDEETKLLKDREKQSKNIEDRLMRSYNKIRKNAINGLAVVSVKRDACGGCFNVVPPQRQAEIRERKKIIVCEHCGRILADVEEVVVEEKPKKTTRRKKAAK